MTTGNMINIQSPNFRTTSGSILPVGGSVSEGRELVYAIDVMEVALPLIQIKEDEEKSRYACKANDRFMSELENVC